MKKNYDNIKYVGLQDEGVSYTIPKTGEEFKEAWLNLFPKGHKNYIDFEPKKENKLKIVE